MAAKLLYRQAIFLQGLWVQLAPFMSFVFAGPQPALVSPPEVRVHPGAQTNLNVGQFDPLF